MNACNFSPKLFYLILVFLSPLLRSLQSAYKFIRKLFSAFFLSEFTLHMFYELYIFCIFSIVLPSSIYLLSPHFYKNLSYQTLSLNVIVTSYVDSLLCYI